MSKLRYSIPLALHAKRCIVRDRFIHTDRMKIKEQDIHLRFLLI
jgi:hypothetical protein